MATRSPVRAGPVPDQVRAVLFGGGYRAPGGVRAANSAPDPQRLPEGPLRQSIEALRSTVNRWGEIRHRIDAALPDLRDEAATEDAHALAADLQSDGHDSKLAAIDAALTRDALRLRVVDSEVGRAEAVYRAALAAEREEALAHVDVQVARRHARMRKGLLAAADALDEVASWDATRRALGGRESGAAVLAEDLRRLLDRIENPDVFDQPIRMGDLHSRDLRENARVGDGRSAARRGEPEPAPDA